MGYKVIQPDDRKALYGNIKAPSQEDIQFYQCDCSCGCGCPAICLRGSGDSQLVLTANSLLN